MPDFANMTEDEQIAFAMQMSMADAGKSFFVPSCIRTLFLMSELYLNR